MAEYNLDETKGSKFNAGQLQTIRVNELLTNINFAKTHFEFIDEFKRPMYLYYLDNIDALCDEIEGWMSDEESDAAKKISEGIKDFCDKNSMYELKAIENPRKKIPVPNKEIEKTLRALLRNYERFVRRLGIKYEVIAATRDNDIEGL